MSSQPPSGASPRPVPRVPKGFRDVFAADVEARRFMVDTIRQVYECYGFEPLETPAVEYVETLGKFLPESNQPDGGIFAWKLIEEGDKDGEWTALRYDLTAPLSRVVAEHKESLPAPFRRYQIGPVYRKEKPGPGRFREFYQFDIDTVGTASMAADAEVCCILADALEALGIKRGDYLIKVNNRKVLNGVLERIGMENIVKSGAADTEYPRQPAESGKRPTAEAFIQLDEYYKVNPDEQRTAVLRAIDKLDKLGVDGVREMLSKGRLDSSGAYNYGALLNDEQIKAVMGFVSGGALDRKEITNQYKELVGSSAIGQEGVRELQQIDEFLTAAGYGNDRVQFDPSVVRGLGYYTGPVFEAALTFDITDEDGVKRPFGAVAGGGRYDDLVKRFTGELVPATGASIGVDRLLAALKVVGRVKTDDRRGPVVVTVMDKPRMLDYQKMVFELRNAGIAAELYLGEGGFKQQLKYADKRNSAVAVIAGSNEFDKGEITLKNLKLGKELAKQVASRDEWRKGQPAQVTVKRDALVEEVKKMLA
ncbi:MAG: histidine--tRNA ligase [Planctomycetota bacterium]